MPWEDDVNWGNIATTIVKGEPMSDLISRKDAIELLKNDMKNNGLPLDDEYNIGIDHAMCLLACVPTAELKTGKWIERKPLDSDGELVKGLGSVFTCNLCGEEVDCVPTNYCPSCGAKMELK